MTESSTFQLSRIYASGWGAGRQHGNLDPDDMEAVAERLNPYCLSVERERWTQGFKDSISRVRATPARTRDRIMRTGE
ncbi:hypothetical protein [Paramagnetospirillum magnetotacticum]|uniref:hypothetical protein n=1 Tax=Paramagnetospirillum magnetotacticum TaxID=188 RepID=UPI0009E291D5|nr:hypothetical protein [Paramagnetospirillum magnetotacticum]